MAATATSRLDPLQQTAEVNAFDWLLSLAHKVYFMIDFSCIKSSSFKKITRRKVNVKNWTLAGGHVALSEWIIQLKGNKTNPTTGRTGARKKTWPTCQWPARVIVNSRGRPCRWVACLALGRKEGKIKQGTALEFADLAPHCGMNILAAKLFKNASIQDELPDQNCFIYIVDTTSMWSAAKKYN